MGFDSGIKAVSIFSERFTPRTYGAIEFFSTPQRRTNEFALAWVVKHGVDELDERGLVPHAKSGFQFKPIQHLGELQFGQWISSCGVEEELSAVRHQRGISPSENINEKRQSLRGHLFLHGFVISFEPFETSLCGFSRPVNKS